MIERSTRRYLPINGKYVPTSTHCVLEVAYTTKLVNASEGNQDGITCGTKTLQRLDQERDKYGPGRKKCTWTGFGLWQELSQEPTGTVERRENKKHVERWRMNSTKNDQEEKWKYQREYKQLDMLWPTLIADDVVVVVPEIKLVRGSQK